MLRPLGQPSQIGGAPNLAYATQMTYDAAGRLATSTTNSSETTTYSYDQDGNVKKVSAPGALDNQSASGPPDQQITTYVYNGRDLPWRTTTGAGSSADDQTNQRTTVTEYDGDGNLIRTVNPAGVGTNGLPYNSYDDSYTSSGTGTDTTGAANLDATIRVYNATNALTDIYFPWGCNLLANDDKTSCATSAVADTRRFKQHFTVNQSQLNQVTQITQTYDWTDANAKQYPTSYTYYPNDWIKTEQDPTTDTGDTKSTSYAYDPAGDQLTWTTNGSTPGSSSQVATARTYWPSGQVQTLSSTDSAGTLKHNYNYYYWPSGQESQLTGQVNSAGVKNTQSLTYFPDGSLATANNTLTAGPPAYDTLYTYDLDGNVATRQQGGQFNSVTSTYSGGTRTYFTYNGDDNETSMNVDGNDSSDGQQPHRTFTTTYWPSQQPKTETRIQCPTGPCTGTPITENLYYYDDGRLSEDTRSSDNKDQSYTYDTDGNRMTDEIGSHTYNALDQEVQWTRGSSQDQANAGSTVSYLLDGTGGLLRQIDSAGATAPDGTTVPITTWYCSASTIGNVSGTISSAGNYNTGCEHDADRVEVVNSVSANTSKVQITNPTADYCYTSLGQLARITIASCPATDSAMESLDLQSGETAGTTAVYQYDGAGDQTTVKAPDPNSNQSSPSIDQVSYAYDALDRRSQKTEEILPSWNGTATPQTTSYGYIGLSDQIAIEQNPDPKAPANLVPQIYDYNSTGQKLGVWQGNSTTNPNGIYHTYALDANGSVEALENADDTINNLNRYHYTPYGNLEKGVAQGGNNPNSTTTAEQSLGADAETNNYRFESFYEDSGIATYDLEARNYLPQASLYTTQDTFEQALGDQELRADPLTQDLYAFAGGNPTSNIEWDGHHATCDGPDVQECEYIVNPGNAHCGADGHQVCPAPTTVADATQINDDLGDGPGSAYQRNAIHASERPLIAAIQNPATSTQTRIADSYAVLSDELQLARQHNNPLQDAIPMAADTTAPEVCAYTAIYRCEDIFQNYLTKVTQPSGGGSALPAVAGAVGGGVLGGAIAGAVLCGGPEDGVGDICGAVGGIIDLFSGGGGAATATDIAAVTDTTSTALAPLLDATDGGAGASRLVIGRTSDLEAPGALEPGEYTLLDQLPDQGSPQANWTQNSSVLRGELRSGVTQIRDASPGNTGGQFLNAERNLLMNRGWTFDSSTSMWNAP